MRETLDKSELDELAYANADAAFRLAQDRLPQELVSAIAREVVRRLGFRMPGVAPQDGGPTEAEIDRFCAALLAADEQAADRIILSARRDGADIEKIYLGYISAASQKLGAMWDADEVSFIDVSLGTGRLYRIIRGLRHAIAPVILDGRPRMPALFALTPGETHTLGIEIAADLFRRDGGDVDICLGMTHDEILELAETRHYGVIVLVANSQRRVSELLQLAVALRISQPLAPFAIAGNLVDQEPEVQAMVGAELVISDIRSAIPNLRRLTEQG